ncbi:MAG: hypothetical protein EPN98_22105 [Phenylobacterium sp.]|uniref:hypothetical protein n=1 Tax=Phenylobacterium sp. TaxID=1871053 RepID=UPI00120068C0|nr:hypothetical protein [Phenylobacterium sp.]TAL28788.1 MAG: hypothetical protein EPN98_22105 [Phenylobacterium sp.]
MTAAMLGERDGMRSLILAALLTLPAAAVHADPVQEARSATAACLAAVIDGAPVDDIDGDDVSIRRGQNPVSCTVRVTAGEPVVIRDAVQVAMKRRAEIFSLAKSAWTPGEWATRETYCNIPGRRALAVFVSTSKPGRQPVLTATVFEAKARDQRCDRDLGVQEIAASDPTPGAEAVAAAPKAEARPSDIVTLDPPPPKQAKKSLRSRLGLGKKD